MKTPHEQAIRTFLKDKPNWERTGLRKKLNCVLDSMDEVPFEHSLGFIPDAFCIEANEKRVQLLEVEDGCPLRLSKMERVYWFWELMDARGWWVTLTICNMRTGGTTVTMHDEDFLDLYYRLHPRKQRYDNARASSRLS